MEKRDFNLVAKIFLGLSMLSLTIGIVTNLIHYSTYSKFGLGSTQTHLLIEAVFNILLIIAAIFIFKKNKYGLIAFISLALIRVFATIPFGTNAPFAYYIGGNTISLLRDVGIFAIAMCFKKNGISGWKSMLAPDEYIRTHNIAIESVSIESPFAESVDVPETVEQSAAPFTDNKVATVQPFHAEQSIETTTNATSIMEISEGEKGELDVVATLDPEESPVKEPRFPIKKHINWKKVLPIAIPSLCGVGILTLLILILAADYPDNFNSFGNRFKYYFKIPNNRLAKEYLVKYRSAVESGLDEMSKSFAETARLACPTNQDLIDSLTHIYFELGLANNSDTAFYKKAIAISERGLQKYPNDLYLMDRYILASYNIGIKSSIASLEPSEYLDKAYKMAEKLLLVEPLNPTGIDAMCRKAIDNDDWDNLMRWSEKGLTLKESSYYPEFLYFNSKALFEKHKYIKAREMYFAAEKLDSKNYYHAKFARVAGIPFKVLSVEIENRTNDGDLITKAGSSLYDDNTRYLVPLLHVLPYRTGQFPIQIKFFHNGTLKQGNNSPAGYTYNDRVILSNTESQTIRVLGWGSDTPGNWDDGGCRVEIWWEGEQLYTYSFNIYSGFWHNLGYGNRFD